MKYCLAIGLHNMFFDAAIIDSNHNVVIKRVCKYDRSKDISNNIYLAYNKYFKDYKIEYIGVGISNNIEYRDEIIYNMKSLNITRYNLDKSLSKVFKQKVYVVDETHLAALTNAYRHNSNSLLYLLIDNKISNSFIVDYNVVELEEDIDLKASKNIHLCDKTAFKSECLNNDLDDEYVSGYFLSNNETCKSIVKNWCELLNKEINKIIKVLPVSKIVFSGYLGEYYKDFAKYMSINKNIECYATSRHRENTLVGVSHLMFKDN